MFGRGGIGTAILQKQEGNLLRASFFFVPFLLYCFFLFLLFLLCLFFVLFSFLPCSLFLSVRHTLLDARNYLSKIGVS